MILSLILAAALAVRPATPEHVSVKLTEQLLSTDAMSYAPVGMVGRKVPYGNGTHVQYSVVSLWVNAIECARLLGNDALVKRLCDKFEPFASGVRKSLPPEHVDYTIYGALPLEVYIANGDERALKIGLEYADAEWREPIEGQICTNHGNFPYEEQHRLWENGLSPQSRIWVDDLYMITLVQVQAYRATGERKYLDRAARTMEYYLDRVMLPNGLCYHAPDVPFVWGRGMGWVAGGMTLLLDNLPEDSPERGRIVGYYRKMAETLLAAQRRNGLWGQLVLDPESWDETSCSAMFAYAFAVGVNRGFLDAKIYRPAVKKAWKELARHLDEYGNLSDVCGGTDRRNSREWYMNRPRINGDPHGQAPLMWLAMELIKAGK